MPTSSTDSSGKFRFAAKSFTPLAVGVVVSLGATVISLGAPDEHAASLVGLVFLASTYWLTLRRSAPRPVSEYGLSFGGLLEPEPVAVGRVARDFAAALGIAVAAALVVFPAFAAAFPLYHRGARAFSATAGLSGLSPIVDFLLGQLLVVALPEEVFFRGYLQTELGARLEAKPSLRDPAAWLSIALTSALFALGHFATIQHPARLAVFFPSLLFGALRVVSGGVGSSIFLHALSNTLSAFLFAAYGL